jgi:hypothetical protein
MLLFPLFPGILNELAGLVHRDDFFDNLNMLATPL